MLKPKHVVISLKISESLNAGTMILSTIHWLLRDVYVKFCLIYLAYNVKLKN